MVYDNSKKIAAERVEKLKREIDKYRYAYHVLNKSLISDQALDSLKHELFQLERQYPELITPDSPTQRVAGEPLKEFKKVRHRLPMLSLEDVFDKKEVEDWLDRIVRLLNLANLPEIYAESKFDGLAISLLYKNGVLSTASTRGDGVVGEDVTFNVKTIEAVPLKLESAIPLPKEVEIRGEAIITKKAFKKINNEQKKKGLPAYANPRNLVAGSIRQLDSKITASRNIDFHAYALIADSGRNKHSDEHILLNELGFKTDSRAKSCRSPQDVFAFKNQLEDSRDKLEYEIDGVVLTINKNDLFQRAGVTGKSPRGSVAFKFTPIQATTVAESIKVQVGRTGVLTPVAILRPIKIGGVTVSRATLHNEDEIKRLGLKIGDTVIVVRAGDVIPDILKTLTGLRTGKEKEFHMPKNCPICGLTVERDEGGIILRCVNRKCPSRQKRSLHYFASRLAFDIDGLGPKNINLLLDQGLIQDSADLFDLKEGDLAPLARFGEKSAQNLVKAIQSRKIISLPRFLLGLGIIHVGERTAQDLSENFGSLENIKKASLEELDGIENIGPRVAASVYSWFKDQYNQKFLEKILGRVEVEKFRPHAGKLKGKFFVLTGTLSSLSREEAKMKIQALSGKISESVSNGVDYVVAGDKPGSKLEKAKKLGAKILNEKEFLEMIGDLN